MFTVGESPHNISGKKDNSKLNNSVFNKWLEILAGKDLQTELRKTENVDFKFRASNSTSKEKRFQLKTEDVKRQQQNTTITLQTKPTKRWNTDCRRLSKMRSIEFATKPTRNHREASLQSSMQR